MGAWIDIQFHEYYALSRIETRHRNGGTSSTKNFKDIILLFSNGNTKWATLQDGANPEWNVITMSALVKTNSIRISATSVYGTNSNGFSEIRFYGCPGKTSNILKYLFLFFI